METFKIGELIFEKFKTEIYATEKVKKAFKSKKESTAILIPPAWLWYDNELLDLIDENDSGKPNKKFGNNFRIIYMLKEEKIEDLEQKSLSLNNSMDTCVSDLALALNGLLCSRLFRLIKQVSPGCILYTVISRPSSVS